MNRIKHDFQWVDGNGSRLDVYEPGLVKTMQQIFTPVNIEAAALAVDDGEPLGCGRSQSGSRPIRCHVL